MNGRVVHRPRDSCGIGYTYHLPVVGYADQEHTPIGVGKRSQGGRDVVGLQRPRLELGMQILARLDPLCQLL